MTLFGSRAGAVRSRAARGRVAKALAAVAGATVIATVAAGCATLPTSSSPQAIGTVAREPDTSSVPAPTPGREPDLLVRDFLKASTEPAGRHAAARQFLTAQANSKWDDSQSALVVDKIDVFFENRATDSARILVSAAKVGELSPDGVFKADDGTLEARFEMVRQDGQWRIDNLPAGVIMDRSQFLSVYHRQSLYFVNYAGTALVPDPRWIAVRKEGLAAQLIAMLLAGPKAPLAPAVRTQLGEGVHLRSTLTKIDGRDSDVGVGPGGIRMDFQGIGNLDPHDRELLAAQVVWTLSGAGITGPYEVLADGAPIDPRFAEGWTTASLAAWDPSFPAGPSVGLHAIVDGVLDSVDDSSVTPVAGPLGKPAPDGGNVLSASLSRDGKLVAAVRSTGRPGSGVELVAGPLEGPLNVVASGATITRPTWGGDDHVVWAVVDGMKVTRAVVDPVAGVTAAPVDTSAIAALGGPITELRLSRDEARAALIVGGRVYVAYVTPGANGGFALTSPRAIAFALGSSAISLDWGRTDTIFVTRSGADAPVVQLAVDGSSMQALPSRNLSPPVTLIDATPTAKLVADSRGVLTLSTTSPDDEQYWREIPGLVGRRAVPVMPG
ncbi:MtrAB system accessory lipoprotein LpqB [Speluncibacter jeojiensis]|uniref:Lipoprotein LpqB n=1 Tax=Speluncibacter jeojiensis TaxID=2710754 RepID=A0A9X4LX80_9ACTN|nr:MtrAB system accessory lipoprotein LpqB [Corynebacteriales bacterium D3-21]